MIHGGYILQPRLFGESDASKMPPVTRELWFYILRKVNHKKIGKFNRGQGFFSLTDIQNDLSWYAGYRKMMYSKPQLTKSLRRLREGNMIATMKATRGVIVTVCNYDIYQDPKNYEGNAEGSMKVPRKKRPGRTKNKNDKNDKKTTIEYPNWLNVELWNKFKEMRTKIKAPMTQFAEERAITKLEKLIESNGSTQEEIVGRSIDSCWKGLFPVDGDKKTTKIGGHSFD